MLVICFLANYLTNVLIIEITYLKIMFINGRPGLPSPVSPWYAADLYRGHSFPPQIHDRALHDHWNTNLKQKILCNVGLICFKMPAQGPWNERLRDSLEPSHCRAPRQQNSFFLIIEGGQPYPGECSGTKVEKIWWFRSGEIFDKMERH